jgi:tripartite ATP-independent transporter DctM subunit
MSIELITILILLTFIILLMAGLPLAFTMGATAVLFTLILFNPAVMQMAVSRSFDLLLNYAFVAVPLFVFMADILQSSGVAEQLFKAVYVWSGNMRGGLAIATLISCIIMAAMVGIVGAEIVTFGLIAYPAMKARGYDDRISLGSITSGGGLATLIPPSVVFIIYAMTCGAPVGDLFLAGIIPGLILGGLFIAYVVVATWINPALAPAAPPEERNIPLRQKIQMLKGLTLPGLIAFGVMGSIYAGIATPSEAAAVGCLGAILSSAINQKLTFNNVRTAVYNTTKVTCMIVWLFVGSQTIIGVYTLAGGDDFVRNIVTAVPFGKWGTIILMNIILILLGCFLDWIGILFLTMPLFVPIVLEMGFNNIWFGVVFCMNMHIAYLSPPFGPSIFYMKSVVSKDVSVTTIYRANMPYLWLTCLALAVTIAFPGISLWLPSLIK